MKKNDEKINVVIASEVDDGTIAVTGYDTDFQTAEKLQNAFSSYKNNEHQYSVFESETALSTDMTLSYIDSLATGIHTSKTNISSANQLILKNVDEDGLMGYTYMSIMANTPTKYSYDFTSSSASDSEKIKKATEIINKFNDDIDLPRFIRNSVGILYLEGNMTVSLRFNGNRAIIDTLPLSLAYPSDYKVNGDRIVEVNIKEIRTLLQKSYSKKRNGNPLYFKNIDDEIKNNFSDEIYKAYKNNESITSLSPDYADCLTINSMGRKFGLSPFFKALRPLVVLRNIESADVSDSKARSKKIIFQKLSKDVYEKKGVALPEQAMCHSYLMEALKTNLCGYTAPAGVESLEFVSSKTNNEDASKQLTQYMTKYIQSLGIGFSNTELKNNAEVKVSVNQILATVNMICSEIERVLNKFYKTALSENNLDPIYAPKLKIADAQTMDFSTRMDLSKYLYGTLNASLDTALSLVDIDIESEVEKRSKEKGKAYEDIFTPRATSYTTNAEQSGRPKSNEDVSKQEYDNQRNEDAV